MERLTKEQIDNRTKWVEALRSGKYKQTTGCLARKDPDSDSDNYCCLGVAALTLGYTLEDPMSKNCWKQTALPKSSGGLGQKDLAKLGIECQIKLIDFNDTDKFTFEQIADIIDADTSGKNIIFDFEFAYGKIPD